ncbi:MAG TPA: CHAT domain-containing protein [Gemmatimonadales bacterium]|nr:CHAT domain-containing protein [Gemmatimonadales bacterium]
MTVRHRLAWLLVCSCILACSDQTRDASAVGGLHTGRATDSIATQNGYDSVFAAVEAIYFAGEYDSAAAILERVRDRATQEGAVAAEARALTWIGLAHYKLGNHQQARRIGEAALSLKQQHALTDQYFRSYNALGLLAWTENRLSDAVVWFGKAGTAARETGNRRAAATALGNLALVQTELGQFREARTGFEAMQVTMAELGDARLEGNALTNLGMLEIRLGDPNAALPLLQRALASYQVADYATGVQSALGQLGMAYMALGDPGQAFVVLDSAFTLATRQGLEQERASILEAMADLYRAAGDFRRALEMYDSAQTINAELGLDLETGVDLRSEADIHVRLGDLDRARTSALEALEIHRAVGAPMEVFGDLTILAEILDRLEDGDGVQRRLDEARALVGTVGARVARVELGLTEARIADRQKRSREVLKISERIEPDLARGGYAAEWEARLLESRALERLGQTEKAAVAGRRALATVEGVRGNFSSGMLRTAFVADKREVYAHLISVLLRLGRIDEAFGVADAARGRVLLERLAAAGQASSAHSASADAFSEGEMLLSEIDRLVESIDYIEETPTSELSPGESRELASLYDRLKRARREYEGFLVQAAETDRDAAAFLGAARPDVPAVRAALGPGQLLVEYFVPLEGQVVVFLVTRDRVQALESPVSVENVASRVRLARELMARNDGAGERLDRVLEALHRALIAPLLGAGLLSDVQELMIVPHQVLVYLPFAALRDPTTGRYLVQDFSLRVLPSAAALPVLADRKTDRGEGTLTVSAFAPFPDRLPGTRREVGAVRAEDARISRYVGSRATERTVRTALTGSGLVHVATHGILNAQNPMFSRLELARTNGGDPADDGRLEVHELLNLPIHAQLVFLSGCETGVGAAHSTTFRQGEDFATLSQAFLHAGAGSVIATLWPVEDAGAAAFAEQFYRNLTGTSPALALARAQRAMLAHERYGSPYYWATYQLAGYNGHRQPHTQARISVPFKKATDSVTPVHLTSRSTAGRSP